MLLLIYSQPLATCLFATMTSGPPRLLLPGMQLRTALRVGLQRNIVPPAAGPSRLGPALATPLESPHRDRTAGRKPARTLLPSRRHASFWAASYPPSKNGTPISGPTSLPPLPAPSAVTQEDGKVSDGRRRMRKQRYLDSLMDKTGELGLKCEFNAPRQC
jgi:hypothetical protein